MVNRNRSAASGCGWDMHSPSAGKRRKHWLVRNFAKIVAGANVRESVTTGHGRISTRKPPPTSRGATFVRFARSPAYVFFVSNTTDRARVVRDVQSRTVSAPCRSFDSVAFARPIATRKSIAFGFRAFVSSLPPPPTQFIHMPTLRTAVVVTVLLASLSAAVAPANQCRLVRSLRAEIAGYRPVVDRVLSYVRGTDGYKGRTWAALSEFVDEFGSRLAGTPNLENSIDYVSNKLRTAGLDNVHAERVQFTGWQR